MINRLQFRGALFDLDGTLTNTIADLGAAADYAMVSLGFDGHTVEAYKKMVGNGIAKLIERALPLSHRDQETQQAALTAFLSYYKDHAMDKTCAYQGVPELVRALKERGFALAVITNKVEDMACLLVNKLYPELFDLCIGQRADLPTKPDPTGALYAMEKLGVAPQECLFIGDSGVDMQTATNAGAMPIGVLWGFRGEGELRENGAALLLRKPSDLLKYLDEMR